MHSAVRNVMRLLDRIKDFEKRVLAREPGLSAANLEALLAALGRARADARPVRAAHRRGAVAGARQRGAGFTDALAGRIVRGAGMSTTTAQPTRGARQRTRSCATELVCHRCDRHWPLESTVFSCPDCGKGLDVVYDYELAARHFAEVPAAERPLNIWHFEELLPIVDAGAQARVGQCSGYTRAGPCRSSRRGARDRRTCT